MSDTKTLGERMSEAKKKANDAGEAKWLADNEVGVFERRLANQASDFLELQQDPDYQQAMLAQWRHWREARKASGLGIEEFVRSRWEAEAGADEEPPVCTCAPMLTCGLCHARQNEQQVNALKGAMAHAKVQHDAARRLTLALYPNAEKTQDFEASLKEVRALVVASEMRQHAAKAQALADTGGGPSPAPCSCGAMEACARCPELQVTPEVSAYIKAQAEDDAKLMGVNSVVRGRADSTDWAKRGAEKLARIRSFARQLEGVGQTAAAMEYMSNALEREVQLSTELNLQIQANINAIADTIGPEFKPHPPACKP